MYPPVLLHQVMMESLFLQLEDMQWKVVQIVVEVALVEILSNRLKRFQARTHNFRFWHILVIDFLI